MFALKLLFSIVISFLITLYVVPMLCKVATKLGIIDVPDGNIKRHEKAVPYLGGVAVYIGFIAGLSLVFPFENNIFSLLVGATLLLFVGLIDDLVVLQPRQKFVGQMLAALCFLKGGLFLKEQFFKEYWLVGLPISFLWILVMTNAFNLVDVMDGLATTIAIGTTGTLLLTTVLFNQNQAALLLGPLLGALVAFLRYNRPPAHIYLGDAGALFVGGFLAATPFLFSWSEQNPWGYITPVIILAIPLLEMAGLILIRTYKGIAFYNASPDHFSLYLLRKGWSKWQVLGLVWGIIGILAAYSLLFLTYSITLLQAGAVGFLGIIAWTAVIFL